MSIPILKLGSKGDHVKVLQRRIGVKDVDGELGPVSWRAWRSTFVEAGGWGFSGSTKRAQRRWSLVVDGHPTAAEKKRAAKLAAATPLAEKAYREAVKLIGTMETGGNNRGKQVEAIIHYAQGQVPEPWCVDFDIWAYGHAGSKVIRPGYPRAVSMMVTGGVKSTGSPKRGFPVRYTFDHTGLFVRWLRLVGGRYVSCPKALATHLETVEGNTGASGAVSDGNGNDGVYRKVRARGLVRDFLSVPR